MARPKKEYSLRKNGIDTQLWVNSQYYGRVNTTDLCKAIEIMIQRKNQRKAQ